MSNNIEITYCAEWNYLPEADRVLAEIKDSLPRIDITKVASKGGVFDVFLDSRLDQVIRVVDELVEFDEVLLDLLNENLDFEWGPSDFVETWFEFVLECFEVRLDDLGQIWI